MYRSLGPLMVILLCLYRPSAALPAADYTTPVASSRMQPRKTDCRVTMCSDTFWKGYCTSVVGPCGQCITIPAAYQGDMSSFGPGNGCFCTLLDNDSCINLSRGITYLHPGQADMTKDNWDNRAKSYICFQSTNKSV